MSIKVCSASSMPFLNFYRYSSPYNNYFVALLLHCFHTNFFKSNQVFFSNLKCKKWIFWFKAEKNLYLFNQQALLKVSTSELLPEVSYLLFFQTGIKFWSLFWEAFCLCISFVRMNLFCNRYPFFLYLILNVFIIKILTIFIILPSPKQLHE